MNKNECKAWYVLTNKPNQDAYAEEQLNNQGFTTYRPLAVRKRKRSGKLISVTESLFPRYMFIQLDQVRDNWAPIKSTYGVSGFVQFGELPLSVADSLIDDLRKSESQFQDRAVDLDCFHRGDEVVVGFGPLKGFKAIFERYSGDERAILLMGILNEQAKLTISPEDIYKTA